MKSPSFQFYPTDYLGSQRVQMMSLEEEGAYCRLLWSCWQHGSVPSDPELAARLIGKGASTTLAITVLAMFIPSDEPGRLVHDRLEDERRKQEAWKEKCAKGGRNSATVRKGSSTTLPRVVGKYLEVNGNTPSPSPSPSPSTHRGESDSISQIRELLDATGSFVGRAKGHRADYTEEQEALNIIGRPSWRQELEMITDFWERMSKEERGFFPNSVFSLLSGWSKTLDRARVTKTNGVSKPQSLLTPGFRLGIQQPCPPRN